MWTKFNAGLDGSAWYLHSLHQVFQQRLENSRSVEQLGEAVREILASEAYLILVTSSTDPVAHAKGYPKRHKETEAKKAA